MMGPTKPPTNAEIDKSLDIQTKMVTGVIMIIEVSNCAGCPWFYMDDHNTLSLCRRTHFENGGNSWWWQHVPDPSSGVADFCPLNKKGE